MKIRWLLVASMFMAMFAFASVSSVSAAPGGTHARQPSCLDGVASSVSSVNAAPTVVTELKATISTATGCGNPYPSLRGVADYKVRAGGGSSFAVSIQGAQALRFQKLYVFVGHFPPSNSNPSALVCTLHIGPNGNGSCYIDTRSGEIVPTIIQGQSEVGVCNVNDPSSRLGCFAFGDF